MLPSLDAFSEFHLTVLAYNSKGAGPESEPYIFQTPEGGESGREPNRDLGFCCCCSFVFRNLAAYECYSWTCFPVPEQPTFLKVIKVDKDTATLSWGLPKKINGNLTGYLLQYQISKC